MKNFYKNAIKEFGTTGAVIIFAMCSAWIIFLIAGPQLIAVDYSFRKLLPIDKIGGPEDVFTIKNYVTLLGNTLHRAVFFKTIWSSLLVTILALLLCYPISFYLAKVAKRSTVSVMMIAIVIPYWINELLRIFAWQIILSDSGIINKFLLLIGIIPDPINFRTGDLAVILGMVYAYILFMVFPLYNAIESLDHNQIDAAKDLGAPWYKVHWKIVIPHAKPGIVVGAIMTFMLSAGSVAAPQLLGSPSSFWFTQVIYTNYETANWNLGTAYSEVLALLCLLFMFLMLKIFKVGFKELVK